LQENAAHRHELTCYYSDALRRHGWPALRYSGCKSLALLRYPLLVSNKTRLLEKARAAGIELGSWFETPLHPLPVTDHHFAAYQIGSCPAAEAAAACVVNLPLHSRVTLSEAKRIMKFVIATAEQEPVAQSRSARR
jgi:dTDP-4-amino-4,6-dideoxygalactose transaminase